MRSRISVVGLIALLPLGALVGWLLTPSSPICQANCDRIQLGMTASDVEQLIGPAVSELGIEIGLNDDANCIKFWQDGNNWISIHYQDGRVREKTFNRRTLWERLDDWYHERGWHPMLGRSTVESFRGQSGVGVVVR